MKGMRYNLTIIKNENENLQFNQISSNEACEIITRELKNLYKIENVKINGDTVYNLIKRPTFCDRNIQNYCYIEKSNIKEKTMKELAKEKAEFNRQNRDKARYEKYKEKQQKVLRNIEPTPKTEPEPEPEPEQEPQPTTSPTTSPSTLPKKKNDNMNLYTRYYDKDGSYYVFAEDIKKLKETK